VSTDGPGSELQAELRDMLREQWWLGVQAGQQSTIQAIQAVVDEERARGLTAVPLDVIAATLEALPEALRQANT
jgi:uncharacterized protein (DUF2267 family)